MPKFKKGQQIRPIGQYWRTKGNFLYIHKVLKNGKDYVCMRPWHKEAGNTINYFTMQEIDAQYELVPKLEFHYRKLLFDD